MSNLTSSVPPAFLRPYRNAGTGSLFSRQQALPNRGAPTEHRRTRTTRTRLLITANNRSGLIPIKLADYHRKALNGKIINASTTLNKRGGNWWLTLTYDEVVPVQTDPIAPVIGVDVGVANFLTSSDGRHYGTFHGKLRERQKRDREKRRRKAKLRACLEKKGVKKLPSTSSRSGQ